MFLRELFEADSSEVAIIFGRFNPPHFGHKAAWETAAQFGNWYVGTNRSTEGPKDPLPFEVKLEAMKTIMPEIEGHIVPEQTWFTLASWVYKEHGDNVVLHIITDSEDAQVFYPAIKKQNGQQGPHGYYNFKDIVWTEAKRLSKATNLRQAIVDNDPEAFSRAAGVPADTQVAGAPFFELVKKYMLPYMEAAAAKEREKAEKERLKAEKERLKAEKAQKKSVAEKLGRDDMFYGGDDDPDGPRTHQDYQVTDHIDFEGMPASLIYRIRTDAMRIPSGIDGIRARKRFFDKYKRYLKSKE